MLSVTPATRRDAYAVAELLDELDRFYGATEVDPIPHRATEIEKALFWDPPAAHVLLARHDGKAVGLATYSFLWPAAGVTRSLYLKELYVATSHRRRGIGRHLMDQVRQVAGETGCSRVEWTADHDNPDAQRFYEKLGIAPYQGKIFYRTVVDQEHVREHGATDSAPT